MSLLKNTGTSIFIILCFIPSLWAGVTGKLAGIVTDKSNGEPLIGTNIIIEGTSLGATTDMNGEYYVINVPPGEYSIKFMYLGYQTVVKTNVSIKVDLTTHISCELDQQVIESGEEVIVTAERESVQKDLTSSEVTLSSKHIDVLPVRSVSDIVSLQAGVTQDAAGDIHIRGGRTTEISYMVDGVQILDPLNRRSGISIDDQSIQELKTITGTFNAEYGQALSGVINIVTKQGTDKFRVNFTGYLGDFFSTNEDVYYVMSNADWANAVSRALVGLPAYYDFSQYGITSYEELIEEKPHLTHQTYLESFNPLMSQDAQLNMSGPIPFTKKKLTFFVSGRYNYQPGYSYGKRYFMPWGFQAPVSDTVHTFATPDNELVLLNEFTGISSQSKLLFDLSKSISLSYGFYYNQDNSYRVDNYEYKYIPDAGITYLTETMTHIISLKQVLSRSTFYDFRASYYKKHHENYLYEDPYDYRYMPTQTSDFEQYVFGPDAGEDISLTLNPNDFRYFGNSVDQGRNDVEYLSLMFDLTSQVTKRHLFKIGFSGRLHDLRNDWFQLQFSDSDYRPYIPIESSPFHIVYSAQPMEFAGYLQDKIEFQELIINVGVRFDYFDPDGRVLSDPMDPQIYDPFKYDHIYKNYEPGKPDSELVEYTVEEREQFWYKDVDPKYQVSPRFGLSFPITEKGVIHFSYGHFYQNPEFRFLYDNPNFWIEGAGSNPLVGNADLKAERTIMYEVGLQQQLMNDFYFHLTGFYRDIRDWIDTGRPYDTYKGVTYYSYVNKAHAAAKGLTLSGGLQLNPFTINFDYTFMTAQGTSSNPQDAYNRARNKQEPTLQFIDLSWDQRHAFNLILNYSQKNWLATVIGTVNSGQPYTPQFARGEVSGSGTFVGLRENSDRKPTTYNVDLRLSRAFNIGAFRMEMIFNVRNIFDTQNASTVWADTGQPDFTLQGINQESRLVEISDIDEYYTRPGYFSEPRFIQFGIRISN